MRVVKVSAVMLAGAAAGVPAVAAAATARCRRGAEAAREGDSASGADGARIRGGGSGGGGESPVEPADEQVDAEPGRPHPGGGVAACLAAAACGGGRGTTGMDRPGAVARGAAGCMVTEPARQRGWRD